MLPSLCKRVTGGGQNFPKGLFGLEVEVEGPRLGQKVPGWKVVADGSLEAGSEFIFNGPCDKEEAFARIAALNEAYKEEGISPTFSIRTSVHVHLNVHDLPPEKVFNIVLLYWIFEDVLLNFCGEDRKGNMFCLSHRDAEFVVFNLETVLKTRNLNNLFPGELKYLSLNLLTLLRYGSLEFRGMKGTLSLPILKRWINIIHNLYLYGIELENPAEISSQISLLGAVDFGAKALGKQERTRLAAKDSYSVLRNFRQLQPVIHATDWKNKEWGPKLAEEHVRVDFDDANRVLVVDGNEEMAVRRDNAEPDVHWAVPLAPVFKPAKKRVPPFNGEMPRAAVPLDFEPDGDF